MAVARWLETDTNTNLSSIVNATAIGAYTADADRMIVCDVSLDQIAGNGDYVIYMTRQIGGSGSSYVILPKSTCTAASGETAISMQSDLVTVRSGDVLTVYIDGLAGDTTTPDTVVRWFEMAALRPTTADRTLDVSAGGEAGVDWANVGSPTTTINLSGTSTKANETAPPTAAANAAAVVAAFNAASPPPAANVTHLAGSETPVDNLVLALVNSDGIVAHPQGIADALLLAPSPGAPAAGSVNGHLDDILDDTGTILPALINTRTTLGSGAIPFTYTLISSAGGAPIADADVWVTQDSGGYELLADGRTNANGQVTFYLDAGTVYVWRQKSGWNFVNPDTETVS